MSPGFCSHWGPSVSFIFFFKIKIFNRDKEGHFISIKSSIYQEGLTSILSFVSMLFSSSLPSLTWISAIFSHLCSFSAPYHLSPWPFCSLVQLVTLTHVSLPEALSTKLLPGRSLWKSISDHTASLSKTLQWYPSWWNEISTPEPGSSRWSPSVFLDPLASFLYASLTWKTDLPGLA